MAITVLNRDDKVPSGPVIANRIPNAARRVNHRSLGRRDKPDEEARRFSIFLSLLLASPGIGPAAKNFRAQKQFLSVTDRLVFLPRAGIALPDLIAILRQGNSKNQDPQTGSLGVVRP